MLVITLFQILDEETGKNVGTHKYPAKLFKPKSYEAQTEI